MSINSAFLDLVCLTIAFTASASIDVYQPCTTNLKIQAEVMMPAMQKVEVAMYSSGHNAHGILGDDRECRDENYVGLYLV